MEDELKRLERNRKEALGDKNALEYARLCRKLDRGPENAELYLEGCSRLRLQALEGNNAKEYAGLCDELGFEPEDMDLYEEGKAELLEERVARGMETDEKYRLFLRDSCGINIAKGGYEKDTMTKKMMIRRYFEQFRAGGTHDLDRMSSKNVGYMFSTLVDRAVKSQEPKNPGKRDRRQRA